MRLRDVPGVTIPPLFFGVCRDCIGLPPDPACWRCAGAVVYTVENAAMADLVLQLAVTPGVGLAFETTYTDRWRVWLTEIGG